MTYEATVEFKFDATYTPTYKGFGSTVVDDFLPEEHYLITAPAADLNCRQYFKLFEKFMLCVGMSPYNIYQGAMSLVFNDYVSEEEQRKVCKEYELTMDEDLRDKFELWKQAEEETERMMNKIKVEDDCELTDKEKCREYNMREVEYLDARARLDIDSSK